jgi:hypothetical protein
MAIMQQFQVLSRWMNDTTGDIERIQKRVGLSSKGGDGMMGGDFAKLQRVCLLLLPSLLSLRQNLEEVAGATGSLAQKSDQHERQLREEREQRVKGHNLLVATLVTKTEELNARLSRMLEERMQASIG